MPSTILDTFTAPFVVVITLASLASSSVGVGRVSTEIDNSATRYMDIAVTVKITQGNSPVGNRAVYIYLVRSNADATPIRADNAGAVDAALTVKNAELIGVLANGASPASNDVLIDTFIVRRPGPKFSIAVVNDTNVNLNATAGNHSITITGMNPQAQ